MTDEQLDIRMVGSLVAPWALQTVEYSAGMSHGEMVAWKALRLVDSVELRLAPMKDNLMGCCLGEQVDVQKVSLGGG